MRNSLLMLVVAFVLTSCFFAPDRTAELETSEARKTLYERRAAASDKLVAEATGLSQEKQEAVLEAGAELDEQYAELAAEQRESIESGGKLDWEAWARRLEKLRGRK